MDSTLTLIVMAIVSSVGYGLYSFVISMKPGAEFEIKRLIVTIVFSLIIAVIAIYTQMPTENLSWETMAGMYVMYAGILVYINKGVDAFWLWKFGNKLGGAVAEVKK